MKAAYTAMSPLYGWGECSLRVYDYVSDACFERISIILTLGRRVLRRL